MRRFVTITLAAWSIPFIVAAIDGACCGCISGCGCDEDCGEE